MDFVKKAADSATGHHSSHSGHGQNTNNQDMNSGNMGGNSGGNSGGNMGGNMGGNNSQQGGEKMDYVDKAFDQVSKKSGHNMDRNTQEKITDAGRQAYEKATGSKVNPKISN